MQKKKEINIEVGHRIQLSRERCWVYAGTVCRIVGCRRTTRIKYRARGGWHLLDGAQKDLRNFRRIRRLFAARRERIGRREYSAAAAARASGRSGRAGGTRHFSIAVRAGACQRQQKGLVRFAGLLFVERHLFIGKKQNRTKEGRENSVVLCAFLVKSP